MKACGSADGIRQGASGVPVGPGEGARLISLWRWALGGGRFSLRCPRHSHMVSDSQTQEIKVVAEKTSRSPQGRKDDNAQTRCGGDRTQGKK